MKIKGTAGNDYFVGTSESDTISGGRGRDVLDGRGGDDVLRGGKGHDTFILPDNQSLDVIRDFKTGVDTVIIDGPITDTPTGSNVAFDRSTGELSTYEWDAAGVHPGPVVAVLTSGRNSFWDHDTDVVMI